MIVHQTVIAAVVVGFSLTTPVTPEEKAKITNFFEHMKTIQAKENARPEAEPNHPEGGLTSYKIFPFEAYTHLNARDLMRAAREGIDEAEKRMQEAEQKEINRHVRENVAFVFEYFPLLATDPEDLRYIRYILEDPNEHPALRRYVLDQLRPAEQPRSLMQLYLKDQLLADRESIRRLLGSMITLSFELPEFRERAMELLYQLAYEDYEAFFQEDPNIARYMEETGQTVAPRDVQENPELRLSNRSVTRFKQQTEAFNSMAQLFARSFEPQRSQPERTQRVARQLIERMLHEIPFEDPEAIRAFLAEKPDSAS